MTSFIPNDDALAYIELLPEEIEPFYSGVESLSHYIVVPDYPGSTNGKLVSYKDLDKTWASIDDLLYAIPCNVPHADFTIIQDCANKTCSIQLSQLARAKNISHITLAACVPGDPHLPLWIWTLDRQNLVDRDVKINYIGTDKFQFYTKRNFDTYSHEQI